MKQWMFTFIGLCLAGWITGQQAVYQQVSRAFAGGEPIQTASPFTFITDQIADRTAGLEGIREGVILAIDPQSLQDLATSNERLVTLRLPASNRQEMELMLMRHDIFTADFQLFTSGQPGQPIAYTPGQHFKGYVKNDPNSVVAISCYPDQVMALIATSAGNMILGPIGNDRDMRHVLYHESDLDNPPDYSCETPDDGIGYTADQLKPLAPGRDVDDCVRLYIEIDDDIVTQKGGATNATNYITGLFNQSIVLYANESINMMINEILAWTTPAPYSGSSSSAMLSSYQANTGSFNGDLSHLVSYQASGGIAAGFNGICNSNPDLSKCFSSIDASYADVPTYSWSVMVVTHEMGHLIGSRHTHACVWNGNNTAIDGCAGSTEGTCPLPGNPSGGGTIMSYCHLQSVGINFNLGFGPQPGNVIRNTVNASGNCLTACGPPPPPPPPSYCASNGSNSSYEYIQRVQVATIDNNSGNNGGYGDYTGQSTTLQTGTSYTITLTPGFSSSSYTEYWRVWIDYNGDLDWADAGEQVAQGSGSSAITVNFTVPAGSPPVTTRMRVSMQYNAYPPICGSFTYGEVEDYTVVIDGSGATCDDGVQNQGETGVDCGGPCPACPTCDDGIQNQGETGVDCGGPCPACPTCDDGIQNQGETGVDCGGPCPACPTGGDVTLLASYFETGWDGWSDGGSDVARVNSSYSWEGLYSIRIQDNSGTQSAMTSPTFNVSDGTGMSIEFYFASSSMENGEDFWVRYYNGSTWTTIAQFVAGTDFSNNTFYVTTVNVPNFTPTSAAAFRIQCDASDNNDRVYIDEVTITKQTGSALPEAWVKLEPVERPIAPGLNLEADEEVAISVYPNPAKDQLFINTHKPIDALRLMAVDGRSVAVPANARVDKEVDIQHLAPGLYLLWVQSEGEWTPVRFIKE